VHSIVAHTRSSLRGLRRAEPRLAHLLDRVHGALGRALICATRTARHALRNTGGLSPHGVIAATVTAGAAAAETAMGGLAAPLTTLAADLVTVGVAVHAVASVRHRTRARLSTHTLFVRSVKRVVCAGDSRAGRFALAYQRVQDGSLQIDATVVRSWAARTIVPAAVGSAAGALPGLGAVVRGAGHVAGVVRNYAFVHAVEIEAERIVAGHLARVPASRAGLPYAMTLAVAA
jgi:hypothetical protein